VIGLGDGSPKELQPYLSNLCVEETYRGKKIGKALVRVVENIAQSSWGFNRMYLHVDEDNLAAVSLYKSEGYRDVGHRWKPFWAGSASAIGYYVKTIRGSNRQ
jgi:ribosomal protein S18 acetylase RimI-like enzyme